MHPAYPKSLKTVGDHLRKARLDKGHTQGEAASQIGVCTDTITNWELEHKSPYVHDFPAIIAYVGYVPLPEPKTLPERLYYFRAVRGWTQERLAEELEVDRASVRRWEIGKQPGRRALERIERVLNLEPSW